MRALTMMMGLGMVVGLLLLGTASSSVKEHNPRDIESAAPFDGGRFREPPGLPAIQKRVVASMLGNPPLVFVENRGQWNAEAKFVARTRGIVARLERDAIVLQLGRTAAEVRPRGALVRLAFEGASESTTLEGKAILRGTYNFFLGNDPSKWRSDVPGYANIVYRGLYDGIDMRIRQHGGQLEYDILLAPGADLSQVVISADGIEALQIDLPPLMVPLPMLVREPRVPQAAGGAKPCAA